MKNITKKIIAFDNKHGLVPLIGSVIIVFIILLLLHIILVIFGLEKDTPKVEPITDPSTSIIMEPAVIQVDNIIATMYNAVEGQCDSDPLVTAGMYKINPKKASQHKWVALSRNLLKRWGGQFDYGDMIKITNAGHKNGTYKVVDTMNKRFTDRMDFLETKGTTMYKYNNVKITKVEL